MSTFDTLGKANELAKAGDLEGLVDLRNMLTAHLRELRKIKRNRYFGLSTLDAKVMKEMHFEREIIKDYIGQMRRKGKVTNF